MNIAMNLSDFSDINYFLENLKFLPQDKDNIWDLLRGLACKALVENLQKRSFQEDSNLLSFCCLWYIRWLIYHDDLQNIVYFD
jgi:hypothetical protein